MRWMTWRATSVRPCEGVLGEEECCALEARVAALAAEGGADAEVGRCRLTLSNPS